MPSPPLTPLAAAALQVTPLPERVLEVECGAGEGVLFLAREFPAARVRGSDRSEGLVRTATARVGLDPEGRVAFKQGAPSSLPYPDDFFDLVAQLDGRPAAAELARVLRPGGQLILARGSRPGAVETLRQGFLRQRLDRAGLRLEESGRAGDGSFSVFRLGAAESPAAGD